MSTHNVDPKIWGPHIWATIHNAALSADASSQYEDFEIFIKGLSKLLPCDVCREDFLTYLKKNEPKRPAFEWTVDLHNHVNKKLGKNQISVESARRSFSFDVCSHECSNSKSTKTDIFFIVALIVLGIWILQLTRTKILSSLKAS